VSVIGRRRYRVTTTSSKGTGTGGERYRYQESKGSLTTGTDNRMVHRNPGKKNEVGIPDTGTGWIAREQVQVKRYYRQFGSGTGNGAGNKHDRYR